MPPTNSTYFRSILILLSKLFLGLLCCPSLQFSVRVLYAFLIFPMLLALIVDFTQPPYKKWWKQKLHMFRCVLTHQIVRTSLRALMFVLSTNFIGNKGLCWRNVVWYHNGQWQHEKVWNWRFASALNDDYRGVVNVKKTLACTCVTFRISTTASLSKFILNTSNRIHTRVQDQLFEFFFFVPHTKDGLTVFFKISFLS